MHHVVTKEHYTTVKEVQKTLLGTRSLVSRQDFSDVVSVGLINFLGGKVARLQVIVRHVDIGAHESLQPLKFLVEFMNFISGGFMTEAEKVEEAVRDTRKTVAAFTHEIQRCELELQHRQQYTGTNVTRTLAKFYRTKHLVPSISAVSSKAEGYSQELLQAISGDRARMQEAKKRLKALVMVQRLLWGTTNVPQSLFEDLLNNFGVTLAICQFYHRLRDIIFFLKEDTRNSLECLASLEEFISNVVTGLSAATEDLDTCLVSLKKCILTQEEYERVCRIDAKYNRSFVDSPLAPHVPRPVGRASATATETEELSKLYCS